MRYGHGARLIFLLLAAGCGDMYDLISLRNGLRREFQETAVGVSLTDGLILTVTLVSNPLAQASCDSQAAHALRVARYVRDNYHNFDSLHTVSIAFARGRSPGLVKATSTQLPFRFARAALQTGQLEADSAGAVELCLLDHGSNGSP